MKIFRNILLILALLSVSETLAQELVHRVVFDLFAGPVLTYQSNVFDINHYKILEGSESISNHPESIYKNESQEGVFFGGIAGIRITMLLGSNWLLFAGGNVKGIIRAESSVNTSIGLSYTLD